MREVRETLRTKAPLAPINGRSRTQDLVAILHGSEHYEVIKLCRETGEVQRYPDLRSYFIAGVEEESTYE